MIRIDQLIREGIAEWEETNAYEGLNRWVQEDDRRQDYEAQLDALFLKFSSFMKQFPKYEAKRWIWKQKVISEINQIMQNGDSYFFSGLTEAERKLFQDITIAFLRDVRSFDRELSLQDVMQALRNIWILAILQCLFQKNIGYHQAMFAYSMLYPYSDNYLDDSLVAQSDKQQFNEWFTERLKGSITAPHNDHEAKISKLIAMIEQQFPRTQYPDVYEALLLIQAAQIRSLHQQDGKQSLSDEELLAISYEKGGTSVIADGILIDGTLTYDQQRFCMQFGFLLQLGDDIQDAQGDHMNNHQTLLSNHLDRFGDALIKQLLQYIETTVLSTAVCTRKELLNFVQKDCFYLIFYALFQKNAIPVSESLAHNIAQCLPLSSAFLNRIMNQYGNQYNEAALWEYIDALL